MTGKYCLCLCHDGKPTSDVSLSTRTIQVQEPRESEDDGVRVLKIGVTRTPSEVEPVFIKMVQDLAEFTALARVDLRENTEGTDDSSAVANEALAICQEAVEDAADFELLPPFDNITWTDATHGFFTLRMRVFRDHLYEKSEFFDLELRHDASFPTTEDCVISESRDERLVRVEILDAAPGTVRFATESYTVDETSKTAFVELVRVNGTAGDIAVEVGVNSSITTATNGNKPDADFDFARASVLPPESSDKRTLLLKRVAV